MSALQSRHVLPPTIKHLVRQWLEEDTPSMDYAGAVVGEKEEVALLYGKSAGVLAGCPFVDAIFTELNCRVEWLMDEGAEIIPTAKPDPPLTVAIVYGKARLLLLGERVALNVLARASGIATRSRALAKIKNREHWHGVVAGTRKTTPGFRLVEKHAMLVGGADMHRMDLSSMVMLKDNHIWSRGSITDAVVAARQLAGFTLKIDVECGCLDDAIEAIAAGADIVMLDNFTPMALKETAAILKAKYSDRKIIIEGSGGITEETIAAFMSPDVDVLSTSSIHQGVPHLDFSLKIRHS